MRKPKRLVNHPLRYLQEQRVGHCPKRFLMHVVEGGTIADKRGARGGWFTCILDLLLMFRLALGACMFLCLLLGGSFL